MTLTGRKGLPFSEVRKLIGEERSCEAWFGAFNLRLYLFQNELLVPMHQF